MGWYQLPQARTFVYEFFNQLMLNLCLELTAFDYHLDDLKPAPKIVQLFALEWLYRLIQEPKDYSKDI